MAVEPAAHSTLAARGVCVGYEDGPVLSGVDLEVTSGQPPIGLIGPSGVGKTTLIDVLHGLLRPSAGTATFNGQQVAKLRFSAAKVFTAGARFMSQDSMTILDPRETVHDRLKAAAKEARKGGCPHTIDPETMLAGVGLAGGYLTRTMRTLSGGEQQRVALATALATRPAVLVLDEPLSAVDPAGRQAIAGTLRQMIDDLGIGTLIASQDLALIGALCPDVAFMAEGRIVARGSLTEVLAADHPDIRDMADNARAATEFRL